MSADRLRAREPAPIYRDTEAWAGLMRLFDDGFGRLSARIELARQAGFHWHEVTESFVIRDAAGAALGHVGVLEHRVVIDRAARCVAGVHAAVTRSDARGPAALAAPQCQGLAWVDARYDVAMLATDLSPGLRPARLRGPADVQVHCRAQGRRQRRPKAQARGSGGLRGAVPAPGSGQPLVRPAVRGLACEHRPRAAGPPPDRPHRARCARRGRRLDAPR